MTAVDQRFADRLRPWAPLPLRIALGIGLMIHGGIKLFVAGGHDNIAHMVADIEHTAQSAELIARLVKTPREERLVRESAQYMVRIKLGKFDGIYREYS